MRVGFVGLGIMGQPMAGHVLQAGHELFVHSRTRARASELLARGAIWSDSPEACARASEVLCINVPDTSDVQAVLHGPRGAAPGLRRGSIVVDFSTISPEVTRSLAVQLAEQGVDMLDAPVTGGEIGAKNATLTIMGGGAAAAFERVRPLLACLGKHVAYVGPSGSGQTLKACNQVLVALNMIGVCEALMLAEQGGLDLKQALETLGTGAGGSWAWTNLGSKIVQNDLKPAFMIRLMQKDLRIVQDAARRCGVPLPGTALAQQLFRAVEAEPGGADLGTQAMIRAYKRLASIDAGPAIES